MALTCVLLCCLLFALPHEALAWGVGVHFEIGSRLLAQPEGLPPLLRELLAARPQDFLYGCMSADITIGKRFTHYLRNCHSWSMGDRVLAAARSDGERACAYGYLVHLAADCVAHGYFVPYKTIRTFNTTLHNHAYWEMRVESSLSPQIWQQAREVARNNFRENDAMLRSVLANTLFSFGTNKRIFNSILLVNRLEQWQKGLQLMAQRSRWTLEDEDQADYLQLAYEAARSILTDGAASPFYRADPTGERALRVAAVIRCNLHHLWLEGKLPPSAVEEHLGKLRQRLRSGITHPEELLELTVDL